jgi:hypothetical protein
MPVATVVSALSARQARSRRGDEAGGAPRERDFLRHEGQDRRIDEAADAERRGKGEEPADGEPPRARGRFGRAHRRASLTLSSFSAANSTAP